MCGGEAGFRGIGEAQLVISTVLSQESKHPNSFSSHELSTYKAFLRTGLPTPPFPVSSVECIEPWISESQVYFHPLSLPNKETLVLSHLHTAI